MSQFPFSIPMPKMLSDAEIEQAFQNIKALVPNYTPPQPVTTHIKSVHIAKKMHRRVSLPPRLVNRRRRVSGIVLRGVR